MSNAHVHRMPRRLRKRHTLRVRITADCSEFDAKMQEIKEAMNDHHKTVMHHHEKNYQKPPKMRGLRNLMQ
jgi:hypothetical protein